MGGGEGGRGCRMGPLSSHTQVFFCFVGDLFALCWVIGIQGVILKSMKNMSPCGVQREFGV